MDGMQWVLDLGLAGLLAATLFHAMRLERALGVLRRDRAALEDMVASFNASTAQADSSVARLQAASDGAGRQVARQMEAAAGLQNDLAFLTERGETLADRLDGLVRDARPLVADAPRPRAAEPEARTSPRRPAPARAAEPRAQAPRFVEAVQGPGQGAGQGAEPEPYEPRTRSQAERDLIKALKLAR